MLTAIPASIAYELFAITILALTALVLQWYWCRHVVDRPGFGRFPGDTNTVPPRSSYKSLSLLLLGLPLYPIASMDPIAGHAQVLNRPVAGTPPAAWRAGPIPIRFGFLLSVYSLVVDIF